MKLRNILAPTAVAKAGMTVRDVFAECGRLHIQALPFCNERGEVTGRVTLKSIMKFSCLPEYMVELAHMLSDQLSCLEDAEAKAREVLSNPIEPYVLPPHVAITSDAPVIKALAVMERNDTSYVFVIDEGRYKGIITIQGIAARMSQLDELEPPSNKPVNLAHNGEHRNGR